MRGNLDNANVAFRALDSNPEKWKEVAQSFINIFDEFSNGIFTVLDEHGAKHDQPFISVSLWKRGKVIPDYYSCSASLGSSYLKQETLDTMPTCGPSYWHQHCWGTDDACCFMNNFITDLIMTPLTCCLLWPWMHCLFMGIASCDDLEGGLKGEPIYYFRDNVEGPVKAYLCQALRVSSIKQAGFYWEEKFVKPVSRLLVDHSEEMKQDAETLQLLLNLRLCYSYCDFYPLDELSNVNEIVQVFFNSLVEMIINCNTPGEMENILCGLLLKNEGKTKIGDKYYKGCGEYNLSIKYLIKLICAQAAVSKDSIQTSEPIQRAILVAMSIVKELETEEQRAHEEGVASNLAFAASQIHYNNRL